MSQTRMTWAEYRAMKEAEQTPAAQTTAEHWDAETQQRLDQYKAAQAEQAAQAAQARSDWFDECQRRWRGTEA
jgi:hypothetical protein